MITDGYFSVTVIWSNEFCFATVNLFNSKLGRLGEIRTTTKFRCRLCGHHCSYFYSLSLSVARARFAYRRWEAMLSACVRLLKARLTWDLLATPMEWQQSKKSIFDQKNIKLRFLYIAYHYKYHIQRERKVANVIYRSCNNLADRFNDAIVQLWWNHCWWVDAIFPCQARS